MSSDDERWLAAGWPFVRDRLPPAPAHVLEVGCGPLGGFVPRMRDAGYAAVGVDPRAPDAPAFAQTELEHYRLPAPVDAVVASLSLHHVDDLAAAAGLLASALRPAGTVVVLEWAWEDIDVATALWCFERLPSAGEEPSWLHRRRQDFLASGQPWAEFLAGWAAEEGIHRGSDVLASLQSVFETVEVSRVPFFFPDLADVSEAEERAAADSGLIQQTQLRFVGRRIT